MKKLISIILAMVMVINLVPMYALAAGSADNKPMLSKGSKGSVVRELQTLLNEIDNAGLSVDGDFGNKTQIAVKNFQEKHSLSVDGIVGKKTWAKLYEIKNKKLAESASVSANAVIASVPASGTTNAGSPASGSTSNVSASTKPVLRRGSTGTAVGELQALLNKTIGAGLVIDNQFGAKTETAVKDFQRSSANLSVDGVVGKNTWAALLAANANASSSASVVKETAQQPASTKKATVKNLVATYRTSDTANISWSEVDGAVDFDVQYYSRSSESWKNDRDYDGGTSYVSTGLSNHPSYRFRVRTVFGDGSVSSWTEVEYVKPTTSTPKTNVELPAMLEVVVDNAPLNADCYQDSGVIMRFKAGDCLKLKGTLTNDYGNLWHKVEYGGKTGYIYSGKVKSHSHKYDAFLDLGNQCLSVCRCGMPSTGDITDEEWTRLFEGVTFDDDFEACYVEVKTSDASLHITALEASAIVDYPTKGTLLPAVSKCINKYGNAWFLVDFKGQMCYIWSGDVNVCETEDSPNVLNVILNTSSNLLTLASIVPGIDSIADAACVPVDLLRGDFVGAGLSAVGAAPFLGEFADAKKTFKLIDKASDTVKVVKKGAEAIKDGKVILSYKQLKNLAKGTGLEVHHLLEKRFAVALGIKNTDEILSIAIDPDTHKNITKAFRNKIGYKNDISKVLRTNTANAQDVWTAVVDVYSEFGMEKYLPRLKEHIISVADNVGEIMDWMGY